MGHAQTRHIVEAILWLVAVLFFYFHSFAFDKEIEIYRYGASTWPRAILLMMALVAIAQFMYHWRTGADKATTQLGSKIQDSAESTGLDSQHASLRWYISTAVLLSLPFIYMNLPQILAGTDKPNDPALNQMKLICAAVLVVIYLVLMLRNHVGGILALPILFAAMLQDLGFYTLAPFFIMGIMFLMGQRKLRPVTWIMPLIMGLLLLFFVKLLYIGLPTGNIKPFYDFGNWVVTLLQ